MRITPEHGPSASGDGSAQHRFGYTADVATQSSDSEHVSPAAWRSRLLDGLLRATALLMTVAVPPLLVQTRSYEHLDWTSSVVLTYVIVVAACFFRRFSYNARALALLTGLASFTWLGIVRVGYQVGPGVGSALVVVIAGLLLGRGALVAAYFVMIGGLLALGVLHGQNGGSLIAPEANDPTLFSNWIRVAFSFALFTGILAVAVTFVVSRIERSLAARTQALEELRAEQSRREQAQLALAQAQQRLLQMQKLDSLGRLAGGVAHDFNNALGVVLGWTDLLRARPFSLHELDRALDQISLAATGAARLTQQLLSFGRKAVHIPKAFELADVASSVLASLAHLSSENIQVRSDFAPRMPLVWADPGQIHQLLLNLCLNARDAMSRGGVLTVSVRTLHVAAHDELPVGDWVALVVQDTGIGMDAHTLKNAFEPFFTTKGELGNGLGLSSVYGIVQQSGGHVTIASEVGHGTTFTVLLPHATQTASAAQQLRA